MLIRHKIILLFIIFSGLLLCFFSFYIYLASVNSIRNSFLDRIKNKAIATKEIYEIHDKVAEKIIISIPEQSEYVFDENDQLIFSINDAHDFSFDNNFFREVRDHGKHIFSYPSPKTSAHKDSYAFVFAKGEKKRIIVITAYNKSGFETLKNLASILIFGNLIFLAAVGLAAYIFSVSTFRPVNDLVSQAESVSGHDLGFRLTYANPKDEIGIVATSFNNVLSRIQSLIESQKSFISYASHELRTPLTAINGILETSLNYDKDREAMRESLLAARAEIQRANRLVNGLLQLAKMESANEMPDQERLNIVDVLLDAISFYRLKVPAQEILFDVPDTGTGVYIEVNGHEQLLRTALINLIDNASKYSHQKKIEIILTIGSLQRIIIKIVDQGIGILTDDNEHLFDTFFRGKNTDKIEGFGLGLSITKKIVALHKGKIVFQKNELKGVTVEVSLPAFISS